MAEKIICIFCGKKADVVKRRDKLYAACKYCRTETELTEYQDMVDDWIDEIG